MTRDYVQRSSVANDSSIKIHNSASYFSLKLSPLYSSLSIYPDVYLTAMRFAGLFSSGGQNITPEHQEAQTPLYKLRSPPPWLRTLVSRRSEHASAR